MKFSSNHRIYEKLIRKQVLIKETSDLIKKKLSPEQLQKLNFIHEEDSYDLYEQMFLRYLDNRYPNKKAKEEILGGIEHFLDQYKFLLETTNLDPSRARNIFISGLMDAISYGSGVYFLGGDTGYDEFGEKSSYRRKGGPLFKSFKFGKLYKRESNNIFKSINTKYSSIPKEQFFCFVSGSKNEFSHYVTRTLADQLGITHAYPIFKLCKRTDFNLENLEREFLNRSRGYLRRLSKCHVSLVNKYKECICREMSYCVGMDSDRSYRVFFHRLRSLNHVNDCKYESKKNILEYIVNCFSKEELELLEEKNENEQSWSFREQLEDRYYSKYPSLASEEEIATRIKKIVEEHRPSLNKANLEVIKDSLLDEIERECFVSFPTHLGNLEMKKNLREGKEKRISHKISKAINLLISFIAQHTVEQLTTEINGVSYDLKEQLLARYRNSGLGSSLRSLKKYLIYLHIYTPYSPKNGKNEDSISRVDLQAFLEEIDMFFLYPEKGRVAKKIFLRLDNGRDYGVVSLRRILLSNSKRPYENISGGFAILLIVLVILFIVCTK